MSDESFFRKIGQIDSDSDINSGSKKVDKVHAAKEEKELFDIKNDTQVKKHKNNVLIISIYLMFVIATVAVLIRAFHLFAPENIKWLNETDLNTIDQLIFSGVIGGVLTKYSSKVL